MQQRRDRMLERRSGGFDRVSESKDEFTSSTDINSVLRLLIDWFWITNENAGHLTTSQL